MSEVRIEYFRPGKETTEYIEDLVLENDQYLKTFKMLPPDVVTSLSESLQKNGLIPQNVNTSSVTKIYFYHQYFDLLLFHDEHGAILGYYSDVGTPLTKTATSYQMTDWFLDIWLSPNGTLFELDVDEFEDALARNLLTDSEAEIARTTFARLIAEVKEGIYPYAYLK